MIVYTGQYNENKSDLLNLDLEPVMASLKAKEGIDQYIKCYAAIEELKNTFLVRSDIEIELRFDSSGNIYTDRYGQKFYDSFINPQIDNKVFTLNYNHVFFSEQKLEIIRDGLEFVHFAIQEAMNGNDGELMTALEVLELMREEAA